jgi:hypothetical protein
MNDPRLNLPSASSFAADVACPGRRRLINTLTPIDEAPDPDAERGTRIHKALETGDQTALSEDEADDYHAALKHIDLIVEQWLADIGRRLHTEMPRELRLWLNHPMTMDPICSAQLDRHYISGPHALVIDAKTGWGTHVPPSEQSFQLRIQALVVDKEYDGLQTIRVAFCKPKVKADVTDYTDYSRDDLAYSEQAVMFHLWEMQQPDAPRRPGSHCRYCPGKAHCPEAGAYSMLPSVLARENGSLDIKERVNALAPVDLVRLWEAKPVVTKILQEVDKRLKSFNDDELATLGMGRGKCRNIDKIINVREAVDRLKQEQELDEETIWNMLWLSKTAIVEALRSKGGLTVEAAGQWIKTELAPFILKQQSEAPLVKL